MKAELFSDFHITSTEGVAGQIDGSINGWMKAELFSDFHITSTEGVAGQIDEYVKFFNEERPAYALEYLTPKQYREKYGF